MAGFLKDEFWWGNITGPHMVVTKVSEALLDNQMVVLFVPADFPWRHTMICSIQTAYLERLGIRDVVIEPIDVDNDNPDEKEPGRFILDRFASSNDKLGYRECSKKTIQEYISSKHVIKNRIVWVKGLESAVAEQWIKFCHGFAPRSVQDGLFVLEVHGKLLGGVANSLEYIDFCDYVCNYDVLLFNSFVLDNQDDCKYSGVWKKYIASVCASICDTDAEVSAELLRIVNFYEQSAIDGIKKIASMPEFEHRGIEKASNHVLWYARNNRNTDLEHRLWKAQIQVLFPIIEMERVSLIEKFHGEIQNALDSNVITQYNERLIDANDVELGTLCYLMKYRNDSGFLLYIPDKDERDWIIFLHECRNELAHASCCTARQVVRLLNRYY